jgi:hypothetical protein
MSGDGIDRFAIIAGEHCCFGNFDEEDGDCRMCEAMNDCEKRTNG